MIGCLVEKEATVPDSYPLTLNALRQACNQSSSRDPVVSYDEDIVQDTLDSLKAAGLVRFVTPPTGSGRPSSDMCSTIAWSSAAPSYRGARRAGVARTAERHRAAGLDRAPAPVRLARRGRGGAPVPRRTSGALVQLLPRQAGQQHARWVHLLGGPIDADAVAAMTTVAGRPSAVGGSTGDRMAALEAEVAVLRGRLQRLEQALGVEGDEEVDGVEGDDGDDGDGEAPVRPA